MRSSLDSVVYLNGKVTCAGWAAPEMAGDEVCLTIRKEDGSILDAQDRSFIRMRPLTNMVLHFHLSRVK